MGCVPYASSYRTSPGRIARPAASALVQPVGPSRVRVEGEDGPGARAPRARRRTRGQAARVPRLEEQPVVRVHDQHVLVATARRARGRRVAVPGIAALDPVGLRLRLHRDRIAGRPARRARIALRRVVEGHGLERLRAGHDGVRHPVDRRGARRRLRSPGCIPFAAPIHAMNAALAGSTGAALTSTFHQLSAGKSGSGPGSGPPSTGWPASGAASAAARRPRKAARAPALTCSSR